MPATNGQSGNRLLRTIKHNEAAPRIHSDRSILSPLLDIFPWPRASRPDDVSVWCPVILLFGTRPMNAMACFGDSNLAMSPITAHHRLVVSTPNPGMDRSRDARGSRLVASVRSFSTLAMSWSRSRTRLIMRCKVSATSSPNRSRLASISSCRAFWLKEPVRIGYPPCVERSLDMH